MTTQTVHRAAQARGYADHGWLQSYHSFSFADYFDPEHVQFGPLRVINEDWVAPGRGFPTHGHRDMEIVTYVLEGALTHQDSMGNGSVIQPGDVQRMSAGRGVQHSEYNHDTQQPVHLLQIWIHPNQLHSEPGYEQQHFSAEEKRGRLRLIASENGAQGSVRIQQDARIYAGLFEHTEQAELILTEQRLVYIHLARGSLQVNGQHLHAGDALQLTHPAAITLSAGQAAEVLVFDLPDSH